MNPPVPGSPYQPEDAVAEALESFYTLPWDERTIFSPEHDTDVDVVH